MKLRTDWTNEEVLTLRGAQEVMAEFKKGQEFWIPAMMDGRAPTEKEMNNIGELNFWMEFAKLVVAAHEMLDAGELTDEQVAMILVALDIKSAPGFNEKCSVKNFKNGIHEWLAKTEKKQAANKARREKKVARLKKLEAQGFEQCNRCGGAGGWEGWPGFTCYCCNGKGHVRIGERNG
jgi:hypothetical protein